MAANRATLLDPLWLWTWFWLAFYGTIYANILILPRQSLLTPPSLALTAAALVAAGVAAKVLVYLAPRNSPFFRVRFASLAGSVVLTSALLTLVALPASMPMPDLSANHSHRGAEDLNVVVILIDTLRADHLSSYGYGRSTTPRIDAVASRGVRFDAAYSSSSWTVPAVASLFSGLPLSRHRATTVESPFEIEPTLAGRLSAAGVVTAGFSSNFLVSPLYGFERGFHAFVSYGSGLVHPVADLCAGTTLSRLVERSMDGDRMATDKAMVWLEAHRSDRFFLYLHLLAPHRPYAPPEPFRSRFVDPDYRGIQYEGAARGETLPPAEMDNVLQRYDAEIAYADSLVGELLDHLASLGLTDSTVVIITSDHGEAFGEHGRWEHGQSLYVEETHIPLVAHVPGREGAQIARDPVSIIDLYPTLLELFQAGADEESKGVSLATLLLGGPSPPAHPIISEILGEEGTVHPETADAVVLGEVRLVRNVTLGTMELFDRLEDPHETRPLSNREVVEMLRAYLAPSGWEKEKALAVRKLKLTEEDRRQLRALGYVQ